MKVKCSLVGLVDHHMTLEWPEGWPVPRVGDEVTLPGPDSELNLAVRAVDWYPKGDPDDGGSEPFVYVVIGRPRSSVY